MYSPWKTKWRTQDYDRHIDSFDVSRFLVKTAVCRSLSCVGHYAWMSAFFSFFSVSNSHAAVTRLLFCLSVKLKIMHLNCYLSNFLFSGGQIVYVFHCFGRELHRWSLYDNNKPVSFCTVPVLFHTICVQYWIHTRGSCSWGGERAFDLHRVALKNAVLVHQVQVKQDNLRIILTKRLPSAFTSSKGVWPSV